MEDIIYAFINKTDINITLDYNYNLVGNKPFTYIINRGELAIIDNNGIKKTQKIDNANISIDIIVTLGKGNVKIQSMYLSDKIDIYQLNGNGKIEIQNKDFQGLNINLNGDGDIILNNVTVNNLNVNITGIGNVIGCKAMIIANIFSSNKGGFYGSSSTRCIIRKIVSGSGNIEI